MISDLAEYDSWHIGRNIELVSISYQWLSTAATNNLSFKLRRYNFTDHTINKVVNVSDSDIGSENARMCWNRTFTPGEEVFDYNNGDRLILFADTTAAKDFVFEVHYRLL